MRKDFDFATARAAIHQRAYAIEVEAQPSLAKFGEARDEHLKKYGGDPAERTPEWDAIILNTDRRKAAARRKGHADVREEIEACRLQKIANAHTATSACLEGVRALATFDAERVPFETFCGVDSRRAFKVSDELLRELQSLIDTLQRASAPRPVGAPEQAPAPPLRQRIRELLGA